MPTALVTGATAGIGLAFARALAARGTDLVLVARDEQRLAATAAQLRAAHGVAVEVLPADLADRAQTRRVAERAGSREAPVDVLVNNAGFGPALRFLGSDPAEEERAVDVMVRAVLVVTHAAVGAMVERGRGTVVTVSSVAGFAPLGTYAAAKAWATTFTESLAGDLRGTGVTATALCPGYVRTEFHQRAGIAVGRQRAPLWMDADAVVAAALRDADRGVVVSVPGALYRATVVATRLVPRRVLRAVAARRGSRRAAAAAGR
jgi:hypothetical protein